MKLLYRFSEFAILSLLWAGGILVALSVSGLLSTNDHSICGPWGCGPSTDALIAVHLGWVAAIWPPVFFAPWRFEWRRKTLCRVGAVMVISGIVAIASICLWQWFVWRPSVADSFRPYIWQRCGFVLVGAIDWPILQTLIAGFVLWGYAGPQARIRPTPETESLVVAD